MPSSGYISTKYHDIAGVVRCKNILAGCPESAGAKSTGKGGGLVAAPEKARLRLRLPSPSVDPTPFRLRFPTLGRGFNPSRARQIFNRISVVSFPVPLSFRSRLNY